MKIEYKSGGKVDVRALRKLARENTILVGHVGGLTTSGGLENAKLASWLHDGTATIPARPYLLQGLRSGMNDIRKAIRAHFDLVKKGKEGLDRIGLTAVAAVQDFVRGDSYRETVPNAPSTIKGKGSDTPLIDTGFLINSLTYIAKAGGAAKHDDSTGRIE